MIRLIAVNARLVVYNANRSAVSFSQTNQTTSRYSSLTHHGFPSKRIPIFLGKMFSRYRDLVRRRSTRCSDHQSSYSRSFFSATSSSVSEYIRLSSKRLNAICSSSSSPSFPPLSRAAFAFSLSLTRLHVVPGILALAFSEIALAQKAFADGRFQSSCDDLVSRLQDGQLFFVYIIECVFDGIRLIFRALYLGALFFPVTILAPFADSFGIEFRKWWLQLVHRTLEKAGPAFIKWGQWAATRPDLFPSDLCTELTKLHSTAPAHSFSYSKAAIEKAFGRKLSDIFYTFETDPVASGSIAQVHRASLRHRHGVQQVAVKVRHPDVGESIRRDFLIMNVVAKVSSLIPWLSWLRLDESVRQFAVFMMSQVDLSREAAHLSRFIYNFRGWKQVSFPKPLYPLVHPSVLVETFEQGANITQFIDEIQANTRMKRDLAHIGTYAFMKMLLEDNFIHADMHPGNILVRLDECRVKARKLFRAKPHLVFLDVGMTAELSHKDRVNLKKFFKAVALRDGRTAAECTLQLSKRQSCPNPSAFIEELDKTFTFWGSPEGDIFHPIECMHQLLDQVRRHRVNVDGNVCTVLVTILVLEGWQRKLDPNFDIMHTLKTLLLDTAEPKQPIDFFS